MDAFPLPCVLSIWSTDGHIIGEPRFCDTESAVQAIRQQHLEVEHAFTSLDINQVPILMVYAVPTIIAAG